MSTIGEHIDALAAFRFAVEVEGIQHAAFGECSGLQAEVEVLSYEEGGCNDYVHKLPGRTKFSNLTLKRGIAAGDDLWLWFQGVVQGTIERKNVSVVLYNSEHKEAKRWNFISAYPVKWVGPAFAADKNVVSIETLELAHEGMVSSK